MTDVQKGTEIASEGLASEGLAIELLDLGDARIETKQYGSYPITFDSIYLLGERVP